MLQLVIIIAYLLAMVFIGVMSRRKVWRLDEFFVMGRKGSSAFITGSLVATIIGGSATVGLAGLGFTRGFTGAWWLLVGVIGLIVLGLFLAKKVRDFGVYTLPELIEKQYGKTVATAASVLIVIAWVGVVAGQIIAAGKILSVLGIGSPVIWMLLFSVVFISYVAIGGQHGVIRTDFWQSVIIFVGIFGGFAILFSKIGGFSGLQNSLPADQFAFPLSSKFGGLDLISTMLFVGLTYVVGPDMYSRLFCAKDSRTARRSVLWTAALITPFAIVITLIGMGASVLFPGIAAEQAFPKIISGVLPPLLGGLVLAAITAAVMSSADSCLMSASTILTQDIIKTFNPRISEKQTINITRLSLVVLGIGAVVLALVLKGVISALLFAYTLYTSAVILPVLAGFYKDKLKVTPAGGLFAVIGGGATVLLNKFVPGNHLDLWALVICLILLFGVSALDNWLTVRKKLSHDLNIQRD